MDAKVKEGILQRITSPWFFTFIPWWAVFNYDFLILVFGKVETLNAVRTYYKCSGLNKRLSIFGCIDFYEWWNNQFFWKLLFPVVATVVSMLAFAYGISWVQDKYNSIMEKDFWWKKRLRSKLMKLEENIDGKMKNTGYHLNSKAQESLNKKHRIDGTLFEHRWQQVEIELSKAIEKLDDRATIKELLKLSNHYMYLFYRNIVFQERVDLTYEEKVNAIPTEKPVFKKTIWNKILQQHQKL